MSTILTDHDIESAAQGFKTRVSGRYDLAGLIAFDYNLIKQNAPLIVDTRGVYGETVPTLLRRGLGLNRDRNG